MYERLSNSARGGGRVFGADRRILAARLVAIIADAVQIGFMPVFAGGTASMVNDALDVVVFAARGEATSSLPYTSGFSRGTTNPFYVATWGLGHVDLRLDHPPGDARHEAAAARGWFVNRLRVAKERRARRFFVRCSGVTRPTSPETNRPLKNQRPP